MNLFKRRVEAPSIDRELAKKVNETAGRLAQVSELLIENAQELNNQAKDLKQLSSEALELLEKSIGKRTA